MVLRIIADAAYNSERNARSRAGIFYFLGFAGKLEFINGPIECSSTVIPTAVSAAGEAEYAALFLAGKGGLAMRYTLIELGWPQPATPITTDNTTATSIVKGTCKMCKSKSMDMRYHWIRERCNEFKEFVVTWEAGKSRASEHRRFFNKSTRS